MIDRSRITNPILRLQDNLRDPSVFKGPDGYTLFYTRYEVGDWNLACNWSVACCTTRDIDGPRKSDHWLRDKNRWLEEVKKTTTNHRNES